MNRQWKLENVERVEPSDPDHLWAVFDFVPDRGDRIDSIGLLQDGDGFRLRRGSADFRMSPTTESAVIDEAVAIVRNR